MPHSTHHRVLRVLLPAAALLMLSMSGCNDANKRTLDTIAHDYESGHFRKALIDANALSDHATGEELDRARYFAGLSAYRLGRDREAERYLAPLAEHTNPALAGPANATLGLIATSRDEDDKAMRYFTDAASRLPRTDAGRAHYHLAVSQQKMGLWSAAQAHLDIALQSTTDADLRRVIRQRMAAKAFTLQIGAYGDKKNADDRAAELRAAATRAGAGTMSIVPTVSGGKRLYLVHAGRFSTYPQAKAALGKLGGRDAWIVTTDAAR